jgi:hypothetical protein
MDVKTPEVEGEVKMLITFQVLLQVTVVPELSSSHILHKYSKTIS